MQLQYFEFDSGTRTLTVQMPTTLKVVTTVYDRAMGRGRIYYAGLGPIVNYQFVFQPIAYTQEIPDIAATLPAFECISGTWVLPIYPTLS